MDALATSLPFLPLQFLLEIVGYIHTFTLRHTRIRLAYKLVQKQIGCYNHGMVTLVADKIRNIGKVIYR